MAAFYLDTSALVKRYIREAGTAWVVNLTAPVTGNDLYTVRLAGAEAVSALTRRSRSGAFQPSAARRAMLNFRQDWLGQYQIVEPRISTIDRAMDLAEQYGLRGYDAVHLAAALELRTARATQGLHNLVFLSADTDQLSAASAEGLTVDNPNLYP